MRNLQDKLKSILLPKLVLTFRYTVQNHESVCVAFEKVDIDCKCLQGFTGIYRGT
jgi:hypothetical protein